jgi:hypothetical protein
VPGHIPTVHLPAAMRVFKFVILAKYCFPADIGEEAHATHGE